MTIDFIPFLLSLKHPFTISGFSRTNTPVLILRLSYEGYTGMGEASMVPYMGESHQTAADFLGKTDLSWLKHPFDFDAVINYLDDIGSGNPAIKAAIDIALHDLKGKIENQPCFRMFGADPTLMPPTAFTIGIDSPEMMVKKVEDGSACRVLKIKLGRDNDRELVRLIRSVSDKPLYVDANQGWRNKEEALDMAFWLEEQGVELIEQPMPATDAAANAWISERSPIPIIGDEAVQRLPDVERAAGVYSGINIKLMKSAGMHEGHQIIKRARDLGLKVLIGCMSETSIATLAGAALAPLCDWADLDGPLLTVNNPFEDPAMIAGCYQLKEQPGLGLVSKEKLIFV